MEPVRVAATWSQAQEWALVLSAAGIPNSVEPDADRFVLLAPAEQVAWARATLAAYDDEAIAATRVAPPIPEPYPWMSGVVAGLLLLWMFTVTGTPATRSRWFERGAADAARVLGGEPWRAVTALTLHLDLVHVAGNALAIAVLLPPMIQRFGGGVALALLVLTGAAGNLVAALTYTDAHVAVGASTAAFGAVGVLTALRLVPGEPGPHRKRWTAPVAGVVLLVTLGASEHADVLAHALGFVVGAVVGFVSGMLIRRHARAVVQWGAGLVTAATIAGCWAAALYL